MNQSAHKRNTYEIKMSTQVKQKSCVVCEFGEDDKEQETWIECTCCLHWAHMKQLRSHPTRSPIYAIHFLISAITSQKFNHRKRAMRTSSAVVFGTRTQPGVIKVAVLNIKLQK